MTSFLKRIAKAYFDNEKDNLADYCFIFPNKRSGTFFSHFLNELNDDTTPVFEPKITTISDFIADFSDYVEASRYDLLFTMYNEYAKLSREIEDFDRFVFWGDMLISDFNDVDRYLADAPMLFKNITDYNTINTDFLTDEQKLIVKQYWGIELPAGDPESFWTHLNEKGEPRTNRESFVRLWEILYPLYSGYRKSLADRGLCYSGMQYKEVADRFKLMQAEDFPYGRVIIVGFNVLSMTEIKIFERLRDLGIGDFYWDFDMPEAFKANRSATFFLKKYVKEFKSLYDISLDDLPVPEIEIISVPSNVGQVKLTGKILEEMIESGDIADKTNAIDTAIVLPSENLFIDLLHSVPESIGSVNITMGYPLRMTSIATLLRNITMMHMRAKKVRDIWCFFYEDVKDVLSHPLLKTIAPASCTAIIDCIDKNKMFMIPVDWINSNFEELSTLFFPVEQQHSGDQVFEYLCHLVDFISERLEKLNEDGSSALELGFLTRYRISLDQLHNAINKYGIKMKENTFFHLIERTINAESVNFIGEPLKGLQIMGVLETRALDFDNVILLSMNERIFPRKHYTRSFIPDVLRRSYGLSTLEFQECIYAYYFYRLISRAKRVKLLYDSRTSGLKGGEMSRYLYQLLYLCDSKSISRKNAYYDMPPLNVSDRLSVVKNDVIMSRLNRYLSTGDDRLSLSASAIKMYLNCPLEFYFHYIEHIRPEDEVTDYMDESTFGTIVHQVSEYSYKRLKGDMPELEVTAPLLDRLKREVTELEKLITLATNQHYHHLPSQRSDDEPYLNLTPLHGEAKVVGEVIREFIIKMFELEKSLTPFYFLEGEHKFHARMPIDSERAFNIGGSIDRIDRLADGKTLRIIDYKTGGDDSAFKDVDDMFSDKKAILQLFLYCNGLACEMKKDVPIQPVLYLFKKFSTDGILPVRQGVDPVTDYRKLNDDVMEMLRENLSELFDPEIPFEPDPSKEHCHFCNYKEICGQAK